MEEYIAKLLSQIRCKKARPYIEEEFRGHMEEQRADNLLHGMSGDEAEEQAVKDMGDPIEVGISMDKIHKPMFAWRMLLIVGIISFLALLVQWKFVSNINDNIANYGSLAHTSQISSDASTGSVIENTMEYACSIREFLRDLVVGFIVMSLLYFLDYTFVAKYSKIIGLMMILGGIWTLIYGVTVNGALYYWMNTPISMSAFMMMYVPVYGAILYKYRGGGIGAIFKCVAWLIVPVYITFMVPNVVVSGIIMICMLVQLTAAIGKGWFMVNKKKCIASLWTVLILLPIVAFLVRVFGHMLGAYQMARLKAWLLLEGGASYMILKIRTYTGCVNLFGKSANEIIGQIPELNKDYVFAYVLNAYGWIAGMLVIAVLAGLIIAVFGAVMKQKNELGLVMGVGCGIVLLMNVVINISCAVGILLPMWSFLPFFSDGSSNLILCYAFIGIVMSIYRYKNVYPKHKIRDSKIEAF